jgi:outer membrane biosynthesis protein TonB
MPHRSSFYLGLIAFALFSCIGCVQNSSKDSKTNDVKQSAATNPAAQSDLQSNIGSADDKCDFSEFKPLRGSFNPSPGDLVEKPIYPDAAKRSAIQGTINMRVLVGLDGKVLKACALEGPAILREASEKAAMKSTFAPLLLNGKPRYFERTVVFRFVLQH